MPAPMINTARRLDSECLREGRSSRSTPAFFRGVLTSRSGMSNPATTRGNGKRPGETRARTRAACFAAVAEEKRMEEA